MRNNAITQKPPFYLLRLKVRFLPFDIYAVIFSYCVYTWKRTGILPNPPGQGCRLPAGVIASISPMMNPQELKPMPWQKAIPHGVRLFSRLVRAFIRSALVKWTPTLAKRDRNEEEADRPGPLRHTLAAARCQTCYYYAGGRCALDRGPRDPADGCGKWQVC